MAISSASLRGLFEDNTRGGLVYKQELKGSFIGYVINIAHLQIDQICEFVIECQSKLSLKTLEKIDNYDLNQGFLIHEWSIDSLKQLLSSSASSLPRRTYQQWKQFTSSPHIHYIEQTGVHPGYHRLGIGSQLINMAKDQSSAGLCTCVTFWPYSNSASANLKIKNGFQPIGIWHQMIYPEFAPFKARIFIWSHVKSPQF